MSRRALASVSGHVEYRTVSAGEAGAEEGKIVGLAAPFNSQTQIGDESWGFRESFAPGAFTKTLNEADVVLLDNHDTSRPVARKSAGTLTLRQSDRGLEYEATPADTSYGRDLLENIRSGNIKGCSFGFQSVKEDWLDDDGQPSDKRNGTQRVVREAKLFEVSPCTFPAYGTTEVSTRDAVAAAREARAAKASYGDLDTCGECGATNQYGQYCAECGKPMAEPKPANKYCPSCGSKLSGTRDDHVCTEVRGKYTADDKKDLLAKGHAFKNAKGDPSYPIDDEEDLDNAIHAVGRGGADHDAIRKYIMGRAKALGLSSKIPDDWNADGSIGTESKSADLIAEYASISLEQRDLLPPGLRTALDAFATRDTADGDGPGPAGHGPFKGTHKHAHPAYGSQGDDGAHEHEHSHDNDANHDHQHSDDGDRSNEPDYSTRDDEMEDWQLRLSIIGREIKE